MMMNIVKVKIFIDFGRKLIVCRYVKVSVSFWEMNVVEVIVGEMRLDE